MTKEKYIPIVSLLLFSFMSSYAQLTVQTGANFTLQAGAQVTVQGSVSNAGTLTNDGTLRVQGNYINNGSYTSVGSAGILELYGTGNSDLNAGASPVANLVINKTGSTNVVKLTSSIIVNNSLTHTNGIFTTDPIANPALVISSPVTAVYNFAAGKEIEGSVRRTSWSGGASHIFNGTNMQVATNGGTPPTSLTVTMIPQSAGGDPTQAEREVKRKYAFAQSGGSGFTADVRYPYAGTELNTNVEANLVPWRLAGTEWNAKLTPVTRDEANDFIVATGIVATELAQEWKLADPIYTINVTANLRGPWNGSTAMNPGPTSILPLSQPYTTTPYNYDGTETVAAIPANVVDWVLIEHRKPASGLPADALNATITGRQAGFLLTNGAVVGVDGATPIAVPIAKQGTAFVTIRHRNHLGLISNVLASNTAGTFTNDFTVLGNSYKPGGADPVVLLPGTLDKYGLWPGDASQNGAVTGADVNLIKTDIANNASGYRLADANISGAVTGADVNQAKTTISVTGSGSGTEGRQAVLRISNIPGTVSND